MAQSLVKGIQKLVNNLLGTKSSDPTVNEFGNNNMKTILNEGDYAALKDGISVIPFVGPVITYVMDVLDGEYHEESNEVEDSGINEDNIIVIKSDDHYFDPSVIQDLLNEALSIENVPETYYKQYSVDLKQLQQARKYIEDVTRAIAQTDYKYSSAQRQLDDISAHINDYLNGVQRKAMRQAKDDAKQTVLALEKERANQSEQLARAERVVQTASDLSLTPVTDENDSVVKDIASDLSLQVSATKPKTFTEES